MRHRIGSLALAMLLAAPSPGWAQAESSPLEVAHTYLSTLYAFDFAGLSELLAEAASFSDPTAVLFAGTELSYEGRDAIVAGFEAGAAGSRNASFEVLHEFESGDRAVLTVTYRTELDGSAFGRPGEWIGVQVPAVTVLTITGGQVDEHIDYVNYAVLLQQVGGVPPR